MKALHAPQRAKPAVGGCSWCWAMYTSFSQHPSMAIALSASWDRHMAKDARERVEITETGAAVKFPGNHAVGEQRPPSHVDIGVVKLDV